jgi:hypothetical protein
VRDAEKVRERWETQVQEWEKELSEGAVRAKKMSEQLEEDRPRAQVKRKKRIRRFRWESPAETRGKVWNIPDEESTESVLNAFLRVGMAEADGVLQDCVGIWQVVSNIRMRKCNRGMVRRITECDENGETMLSAFRRAQRHVLGMIKPRNARVKWISQLTIECEPPENWPHSEAAWDSRYAKRCQHIVDLGRHLLKGKLPPPRPGVHLKWLPHRPIAWGGRCENKKASCDDEIACARGLSRIQENRTENAFWCRPGVAGCYSEIDPVCHALREKMNKDLDRLEKGLKKRGLPSIEKLMSSSEFDSESFQEFPGDS